MVGFPDATAAVALHSRLSHTMATASSASHAVHIAPLWRQFIDHRGGIKQHAVEMFEPRVAAQQSLDGIAQCFPLRPPAVEAPLDAFDHFYCNRSA
jgi:hypothetical protein